MSHRLFVHLSTNSTKKALLRNTNMHVVLAFHEKARRCVFS